MPNANSEGASSAQPSAPKAPSQPDYLDSRGRERPRFLLDYPQDPELQRLCRAFERGDFATVRQNAPKLAESSEDPAVKAAARELRKRIDPDPLTYVLLAMALGLLAVLVGWTFLAH